MSVNEPFREDSNTSGLQGVMGTNGGLDRCRRASVAIVAELDHIESSTVGDQATQSSTHTVEHGVTPLRASSSRQTMSHDTEKFICPNTTSEQRVESNANSRSMPIHSRTGNLSRSTPSARHDSSIVRARIRKSNHKQKAARLQRATDSKAQTQVPQAMQMRWRVGAAPSMALTLTRQENQISQTISQAIAYYTSMSEIIWGPKIRTNMFFYDLDNRVEVLRDSTVAAASLVATNKLTSAQQVLNRVLPGIDDQLRNPHPAMYVMMAELSLNLVKSPGLALINQVKQHIAARASTILGAEHPLTSLLRLELPQERNEMLGEQLWKAILPILAKSFGADHYQTSTQVYVAARNLAACGKIDEAVTRIQSIIDRWCNLYGSNSLIVCYSKIELANILANAGSDMKAEFVVSDALRTSDMIHRAELRNEDCNLSEKRHRESSIAFPRVAGLRTLGRLHSLRGNYGAAAHYYSQAVAVGLPSLGIKSAAVELAQAELDSVRKLGLQRSQQDFPPESLTQLTHIVASPII